jgi:hypothetical protein
MHSEEARAKISAAMKGRWAAGEYDFLRKPKPVRDPLVSAESRRRKCREATKRLHAAGRIPTGQLFTPESRRKAALAFKTSPKARAAREWAVKFRIAKIRARKIRASPIFNELAVVDLVLRYQRTGDEELFARIIYANLPLIDSSIRRYSPQSASDFTEVRHELILKLATLIPKYDPRRGRAFSFFTHSIKNFLVSNFDRTVRRRSRFQLVDNDELFDRLDANPEEREEPLESEEFLARLRELVGPAPGWQWKWQWEAQGRLPIPAWRAEWKWKFVGKLAA